MSWLLFCQCYNWIKPLIYLKKKKKGSLYKQHLSGDASAPCPFSGGCFPLSPGCRVLWAVCPMSGSWSLLPSLSEDQSGTLGPAGRRSRPASPPVLRPPPPHTFPRCACEGPHLQASRLLPRTSWPWALGSVTASSAATTQRPPSSAWGSWRWSPSPGSSAKAGCPRPRSWRAAAWPTSSPPATGAGTARWPRPSPGPAR